MQVDCFMTCCRNLKILFLVGEAHVSHCKNGESRRKFVLDLSSPGQLVIRSAVAYQTRYELKFGLQDSCFCVDLSAALARKSCGLQLTTLLVCRLRHEHV